MSKKTFQEGIIRRFMSQYDYDKFLKNYQENCHGLKKGPRAVVQKDLDILKDYKAGVTNILTLAGKHNVSQSQALTSLRIAALSLIK